MPRTGSRRSVGPTRCSAIPRPGAVITLQGKGVPKLGNPVARGNHLFSVKVQLPTKLNGEERQLLEQLAGHHTSKGQRHPHKSGLFGGLFG